MRILFDHQTFSLQDFGGISRYNVELIKGINQTAGQHASLSALFSNNVHVHEAGLGVRSFFPAVDFSLKRSLLYRLNQLYSKLLIRNQAYDLLHATYYDPYFLTVNKEKPFVITFYDMIFEKLSSEFSELKSDPSVIERKRIVAQKAARIIAISQHTKNDIVEILNVTPDKIDVIHLGSSLAVSHVTSPRQGDPYLLFVGNRDHYKNFIRFLRAAAPVLRTNSLKLICAGGGPFTATEQELIKQLDLTAYVTQQPITSDTVLQRFYQSALAFVFPSLYEGFGIPILEAFACNCPCVLSNTSSLPEVAGNAAIYFDPANETSIHDALQRIITDSTLRGQLVDLGRERLLDFSWERTVRETIQVYERCLGT
ncbi:glycosyltransferase family 1 protein [Spirosoma flavus]